MFSIKQGAETFRFYFLQKAAHRKPEIVTVTLNKPLNSGIGVSIVAAKVSATINLDAFTGWNY